MNTKAVLVLQVPQALVDALDAYAYNHDIPRSTAIRNAINTYIGRVPPPSETLHGNTKYLTPAERTRAQRKLSQQRTQRYRDKHTLSPQPLENTLENWTNIIMNRGEKKDV